MKMTPEAKWLLGSGCSEDVVLLNGRDGLDPAVGLVRGAVAFVVAEQRRFRNLVLDLAVAGVHLVDGTRREDILNDPDRRLVEGAGRIAGDPADRRRMISVRLHEVADGRLRGHFQESPVWCPLKVVLAVAPLTTLVDRDGVRAPYETHVSLAARDSFHYNPLIFEAGGGTF